MSKSFKVALVICLQVLIVLLVLVSRYSILAGGVDVLVGIRPVDPYDPIRGDYVTFNLDISTVYSYNEDFKNGETVYVPLRKNDKLWSVSGNPLKQMPQSDKIPSNVIYIKGTVDQGSVSSVMGFDPNNFGNKNLRVKYGIEEYFIEQGKGRTFNFNNHVAYARVAVDSSGRAILKQIYIDDLPWPDNK